MSVSPLAPPKPADLPAIAGVTLGAVAAGIRYGGRTDLCMFELAARTTVAGVFTRSLTASAPVLWCRDLVRRGGARAILINSGNANAFTGKAGEDAVRRAAAAAAGVVGCKRSEVLIASTGVIGEPLPVDRIIDALQSLRCRQRGDGWREAAEAIMTTDTFPKLATRQANLGGVAVTINGIAKGSGMIAPDMATLLAFVVTDAAVPAPVLQKLLEDTNRRSFNSITVDSDTSTSDTVLLCATGQASHEPVRGPGDKSLRGFRAALQEVMTDLAQQIVRDGEGASKFVTVTVTGAASANAARRIGLAIGNSPLVKTAIAGEDANWGRIVMAVGKAGERADRDKLSIRIGGIEVAGDGARAPDYDETPIAAHMKGQEIDIEVDVGVGRGRATIWTCDLTHGYISINADYRS